MQPVPASDVIELVVAVDFDREVLGVVLLDIDVDIGALVFADFLDAEAERSVVVLAVGAVLSLLIPGKDAIEDDAAKTTKQEEEPAGPTAAGRAGTEGRPGPRPSARPEPQLLAASKS